ncbi:MAG TPA: tRNA pseudouridine synthase A [Microbacteriaceae bacterium]|nr:tRNA pseudouridine synthase A [Microbacteriaceae bacterium]
MSTAPGRIRIDIAYDGGRFHGWAAQPGLRTVQGTLEEAVARLLRVPQAAAPRLTVAGRTDAGVHATGQVAHLDLTGEEWGALAGSHAGRARTLAARSAPEPPPGPDAVDIACRRINGALRADDVRVLGGRIAPDGFDARFSALWRRYLYRVADGAGAHDPLERHRTLWHPTRLDVSLMDRAARQLGGLHDFAAYCKPRPGSTTIRELQDFRWRRAPDGVLEARVRADAFCHGMVRALVGACIAVGCGRLEPHDPLGLRNAGRRTSAFAVAPAHGLTLVEVGYPDEDELAERARQTRALRTLTRPD